MIIHELVRKLKKTNNIWENRWVQKYAYFFHVNIKICIFRARAEKINIYKNTNF